MIDRRLFRFHTSIVRLLSAIKQRQYLCVSAIAFCNLEEDSMRKSFHQLKADNLFVEPLHRVKVFDTESDFSKCFDGSLLDHL